VNFECYALLDVVVIINCIPTSLLNNISLYEKLHGNHYNISTLKVFYCLCYTNT